MSGQAFDALSQKRKKIASELADLEHKIYNAETEYISNAECTAFGNVLKGFEGFLTSKSAAARNKGRAYHVDERAFSLSSWTSPATRELHAEREYKQQQAEYGGVRGKGTNPLYGQVKGMTGSIPGKRY